MSRNEKMYLSVIAFLFLGIFASVTGMNYYKAKYRELLEGKSRDLEVKDKTGAAAEAASEKKKKAAIGDTLSKLKKMQGTLDEKENRIKLLQKDVVQTTPTLSFQSGNSNSQTMEERYADMKQNDPGKYKAYLESYRQMVLATAENNVAQKDFFSGLDTSGLNEEQMKNHNSLLEKLAAFGETLEKYKTSEELSEMGQVMTEKMNLMREIYPLINGERDAAIIALGKSIGYSDEEAIQFRDYLAHLDKMASTPGVFVVNQGKSGQTTGTVSFQTFP